MRYVSILKNNSLSNTQNFRYWLYISILDYFGWQHAHETCIITIVIFGYVRSITNHRPSSRCQWFITMATYWLHCDVTVMHVRFVSPLSISYVKNSIEITSDLHCQVNILSYHLIYWQFTPEEIMAVIKSCWACFWLICYYHSVF